jgi:hypothetical protein
MDEKGPFLWNLPFSLSQKESDWSLFSCRNRFKSDVTFACFVTPFAQNLLMLPIRTSFGIKTHGAGSPDV